MTEKQRQSLVYAQEFFNEVTAWTLETTLVLDVARYNPWHRSLDRIVLLVNENGLRRPENDLLAAAYWLQDARERGTKVTE